jgi:hypothetical protein
MERNEKPLPPHWKLDGYVKRCSVCGYPFPEDVRSIDKAFKEHMQTAHRPGAANDTNQAAARSTRETADK